MTHRILGKVSQDQIRTSPFGADLESKGWEEVSLERVDNPPIKCAGRQLTRHWAVIYPGEVLSVSLWQRKKSGFLISFSTLVAGSLKTDAVAVESLAEAMIFLEDYCAHPLISSPPVERLVDSILHLHRTLTYTQVFSALVGEALAVWSVHALNPAQGRIKERVQA